MSEASERKSLTPEDVREYIYQGGNYCPYCGSAVIGAIDEPECSNLNCIQEMACIECDSRWQDTYTLVGISPEITVDTRNFGPTILAAPNT